MKLPLPNFEFEFTQNWMKLNLQLFCGVLKYVGPRGGGPTSHTWLLV